MSVFSSTGFGVGGSIEKSKRYHYLEWIFGTHPQICFLTSEQQQTPTKSSSTPLSVVPLTTTSLHMATMAAAGETVRSGNNDRSNQILDRLFNIGMTPKDLPQHGRLARASVLVPLLLKQQQQQHDSVNLQTPPVDRDPCQYYILLTKRSESLRSHAGEVCFPGGKQDPDDKLDDVATALRETMEEVGIDARHVTLLCRLDTVECYTGLCVTPVVALIDPPFVAEPSHLTLSHEEVEVAFTVPLDYFLDESNLTSKYDVDWRGGTFELRTYHYYSPETRRTFKIWGLTAHIAHQVARVAFRSETNHVQINDDDERRLLAVAQECKHIPTVQADHSAVSGYLFRLEGAEQGAKPYWRRKFFVFDDRMLHFYDDDLQAARRAASATKKNRLVILSDINIHIPETAWSDDDDKKFEFIVTVLSTRHEWHLAAQSDAERVYWIRALHHNESEMN